MPGKNGMKGKGQRDRGGPMGHGGGNADVDATAPSTNRSGPDRGRSASSPGHLKKDAGAQSAREFAPGHVRRPDRDKVVPPDANLPED